MTSEVAESDPTPNLTPQVISWDNRLGAVASSRAPFASGGNVGFQRQHYRINVSGREIAYCYIRKNASSAFKRMFCKESPSAGELQQFARRIDFMKEFHDYRPQAGRKPDVTIFVHRDPVKRAISFFQNKFIARAGNEGVFKHFKETTGYDPKSVSFRDFVTQYLKVPEDEIDPHCRSQFNHLLPIKYTHAIDIGVLHKSMVKIVGGPIANRYFRSEVNKTPQDLTEEDASATSSAVLHQHFLDTGRVPWYDAFTRDPQLIDIIRDIYAKDVWLRKQLGY